MSSNISTLLRDKITKESSSNILNNKLSKEEIDTKGLQDFYELRKKWSDWIIFWICVLLLFHIVIVFLVGFEKLIFDRYFIQTLLIGDFVEITGMGLVVVKFLNSHKEKNNTKKITKKTNETHA